MLKSEEVLFLEHRTSHSCRKTWILSWHSHYKKISSNVVVGKLLIMCNVEWICTCTEVVRVHATDSCKQSISQIIMRSTGIPKLAYNLSYQSLEVKPAFFTFYVCLLNLSFKLQNSIFFHLQIPVSAVQDSSHGKCCFRNKILANWHDAETWQWILQVQRLNDKTLLAFISASLNLSASAYSFNALNVTCFILIKRKKLEKI